MREPNAAQEAALVAVGRSEMELQELARVFIDPADAFVFSPVPLTVKQLAHLYRDTVPDGDDQARFEFPRTLRQRHIDERWTERRAIYQAAKNSARRDAILQAEAEVMAVVGLEFHAMRIRSLMHRWELLDSYVMERLILCETGQAQFTAAVRDACVQLKDVEATLEEIMPKLGITEKAQEMWTSRVGNREAMIARIADRFGSIEGRDRTSRVFELVQGGAAVAEGAGGD